MKYSYAFAAVLLAGSMVAPAFAGVADPGASFKNDKTTYRDQIVGQKQDTREETEAGNLVDGGTRNATGSYTGTLTVKEMGKVVKTYTYTASSAAELRNKLRGDANYWLGTAGRCGATTTNSRDYTDADGDWHVTVKHYINGGKNKASYYSGGGDWMGDCKYDETTTVVSSGSHIEYSAGDTHTRTYTEEYNKYVDTDSTTATNVGNGSIIAGSGDSVNRMYVAQGSVERLTDVVDNYDHYTTTVTVTSQDTVATTVNDDVYIINGVVNVSPIVLDLDGNGKVEASNGNYNPHASFSGDNAVMFDFYGNGFPVATEWVGKTDGLLCRPDVNGNVNGTNLFGTANGHNDGYEAMAGLDADNDGYLSGEELAGLYVWTDVNSNGHAEASELHSLDSLGITAIGVNGKNNQGTFIRNGKEYKTFDWWPTTIECRKANMAQK